MKKPVVIIGEPLYSSTVAVFAGNAEQEAIDWYHKQLKKPREVLPKSTGRRACFMHSGGHIGGVMWFRDASPVVGEVAHECVHAAINVLRHVGIDFGKKSAEESLTYLVEFLVDETLAALAKKDRKITRRR